MVNLLGEKGFEGEAVYEGMKEVLALKGVYVHLYGKTQTKAFRKMGHISITGDTVEEVKAKANYIKNTIKVKA